MDFFECEILRAGMFFRKNGWHVYICIVTGSGELIAVSGGVYPGIAKITETCVVERGRREW